MARIFITGSADGIGLMEARMLVSQGHQVVVHGRSRQRANEALSKVPGALTAVAGDLASIAETKSLADQVDELGPFDAVIHNAGIYLDPRGIRTVDGLPQVFAVNSLAPYILTCPPTRVFGAGPVRSESNRTSQDQVLPFDIYLFMYSFPVLELHNEREQRICQRRGFP